MAYYYKANPLQDLLDDFDASDLQVLKQKHHELLEEYRLCKDVFRLEYLFNELTAITDILNRY